MGAAAGYPADGQRPWELDIGRADYLPLEAITLFVSRDNKPLGEFCAGVEPAEKFPLGEQYLPFCAKNAFASGEKFVFAVTPRTLVHEWLGCNPLSDRTRLASPESSMAWFEKALFDKHGVIMKRVMAIAHKNGLNSSTHSRRGGVNSDPEIFYVFFKDAQAIQFMKQSKR